MSLSKLRREIQGCDEKIEKLKEQIATLEQRRAKKVEEYHKEAGEKLLTTFEVEGMAIQEEDISAVVEFLRKRRGDAPAEKKDEKKKSNEKKPENETKEDQTNTDEQKPEENTEQNSEAENTNEENENTVSEESQGDIPENSSEPSDGAEPVRPQPAISMVGQNRFNVPARKPAPSRP